jgi:hypothetical protein
MALAIFHFLRQSHSTNNDNFNSTLQTSGLGATLTSFRIGSLNFSGNRALTNMQPFIGKILVFCDVTPCSLVDTDAFEEHAAFTVRAHSHD